MIPRYTRPEMAEIWSEDTKYSIWLEIETLACEAMAAHGKIPETVPRTLREKGGFDPERIVEIEKEVKHDVIAFLTNLAEYVGEDARFVHQGLTSSDVLDTTLAVQFCRALDLLIEDTRRVLAALKDKAVTHKDTPCVGRSHGIHAEPPSFGLKLLGHYAAFDRARQRLETAREEIATCALSGAVGTYATIDPQVEAYVASKMGLKPEPHSTQIIPRDRHAAVFSALGLVAGSMENLAIEIRHLQRTEVREAEEPFAKGQKGSSAMPHKRNPILTENITGLARIVRAAVTPAMENIALWHERDISHSSVERVMAPDACIAMDFALNRLAGVIEGLQVYPDAMQANLDRLQGLVFSQAVLLALTQAGMSREGAYTKVQEHAMAVWDSLDSRDEKPDFQTRLASDAEITACLDETELNAIFNVARYHEHVDMIFKRVLGTAS